MNFCISIAYIFISLWIPVAYADQKQEAINHAIDAAKVQTGYTAFEQKLRKYGETESLKYISKVGIDQELGVALYCVKVSREKSITFRINNTEQISLGMNKTELRISF